MHQLRRGQGTFPRKCLAAALLLAAERPLAGVDPHVPGEAPLLSEHLAAALLLALALEGSLACVDPHVCVP